MNTETEPFGVTYERLAFDRLHARLARKYGWRTALEIPAHGAKAAPSLYSLGLARAGVHVTLNGGEPKMEHAYRQLQTPNSKFQNSNPPAPFPQLTFDPAAPLGLDTPDTRHLSPVTRHPTPYADKQFDLAWNFAALPALPDPFAALRELGRVARHVLIAGVNGWNYGFPSHRLAHALTRTPWTHGAIALHYPGPVKKLMRQAGLKPIEIGVLDCPPWPDPPGLRDIRLHRNPPGEKEWKVPTLDYLQSGFPRWMELTYSLCERLPLPWQLKLPYAHLFYILAESPPARAAQPGRAIA